MYLKPTNDSSPISTGDHTCALCAFQGYITYSKKLFFFFFFFSISKPSLSGSEWLMILRWIVERSSSGSARPLGGPGPPIAGFVMVCPWRPRYLPRYTVLSVLSPIVDCTVEHLNYSSETTCPPYAALYCVVYLYSHMMFLYIFFFLFQGRVEILNGEVTIHKVQQADSGMYQCVAENKYGAIYSNAELKILGNYIMN